MFERNLILKHLPVKDCFLYVNTNLKFLSTGTCVQLIDCENNVYYFSIGNYTSDLDDNYVGISSLLAKTLGIEDNIFCRVSQLKSFPSASSITIFPTNQNDYDVLVMLSNNVQETLLNQIRVVYRGQKFVIWIGNNISVSVCVENVNPVSPSAVDFLTEVHIEECKNIINPASINHQNPSLNKEIKFLHNDYDDSSIFQEYINKIPNLIYRIVPLNKLPTSCLINNQIKPFTAFVSKKAFPNHLINNNHIYSMKLITHYVDIQDLYVKLDFFDENLDFGQNLYVTDEIMNYFDCNLGARVLLDSVSKYPFVAEIQINSAMNSNLIETFKEFLAESDDKFVLNCDFPVDIGNNLVCSLKFLPDNPKFCVVDDDFVRNVKCSVSYENVVKKCGKKDDLIVNFIDGVANFDEILDECVDNFNSPRGKLDNFLIIGKPGTGKSTILKKFTKKIQNYPYFIHTKQINCKTIKGKTMDSIIKLFTSTFFELILHEPSVLILDDLHVLCENIQDDPSSPNHIYHSRISEMLHVLLKSVTLGRKIGVLATCESIEKLNRGVYTSRGSHFFKNVCEINELGKIDRIKILKFLFKDNKIDQIDFNLLSIKTESFVMQDLYDFFHKTIFELYKNDNNHNEGIITINHIEKALKNTSVISLQNVQLHNPGDKDFSNIGGLKNIKNILLENLLWPGKYPEIFSNAPLRLQSGLLLYGPPGSGKTILAAAAAKQCGMRLISVKGPELLSKYIGASEEAVRNIFQKAQSAKPCILFFDEFDSLAPKRGHDNTGVTDRVVNQLLTQLDGVESLTGVCVLAATSRPDLLDSALLRPGRLDKQILCPLPDKDDRLDILRVLSRNLSLDDGVDLEVVAEKTEFYSGADLQSLLYTAHMFTIDYSVESDEILTQDLNITQIHLEKALNKTKPSLSSRERLKYERIYKMFQSGGLDDFRAGSKATLA